MTTKIEVGCQCGKRFAALPHLAGKSVKCPSCGSPITIPAPRQSSAPIVVVCQCGQRFSAQPHLAGKRVSCPVCRQPITIPNTAGAAESPQPASLQLPRTDDDFWDEVSAAAATPSEQTKLRPIARRPVARQESRTPVRKKHRGPIPDSARVACMALATGAFLWTIFTGMGMYLMSTGDLGAMGEGITHYLACLAIGGYVSAFLVWRCVPFAMVPAVIISLFYLLFCPLGTIVAIIIFIKLFDEDTRRYLARE